jgi:dTDP-4-dehydrorhamnose reductase
MTTAVLMRTVILGASGLVGGSFHRELEARGRAARGTYLTRAVPGLDPLDLAGDTAAYLERSDPTLVILASALTHVDYCESHPEETYARNVSALEPIVAWCAARDVPLVFFSTDYVFDGAAGPYSEEATPRPLSVYWRSKLDGERLVATLSRYAILRITNVFDVGHDTKNFLHRCIEHLRDRKTLVVPADQWATPTSAPWLARQTLDLIERGVLLGEPGPRVLHVSCDELVSRVEFALHVASMLGADTTLVEGRPTEMLQQAALRPLRGGLDNHLLKRLLGVASLPLDEALREALPRMQRLYAAR